MLGESGPAYYALYSELVVLGIVAGGFLILLGARHVGGNIIFVTVSLTILTPFFVYMAAEWLGFLPLEVVAVLGAIIGLLILQGVIRLIFGKDVASQVVGNLLTGLLIAITYPVWGPLKWVRRMLRDLNGPGGP